MLNQASSYLSTAIKLTSPGGDVGDPRYWQHNETMLQFDKMLLLLTNRI